MSRLTKTGPYNLRGVPAISYKETATYRPSMFTRASPRDTTKKTIRFVPEAKEASGASRTKGANKASGANGANDASGANEASWANRVTGASWNSIIRWLFYMLPICLVCGIVYFYLAPCMNLDSGPSALPVPPTELDTIVLSRTEVLEQQVRMLQDEMLKFNRIKELPPGGIMSNVALESQGARVLARLSSKTYESTKSSLSICIRKFLASFWRSPVDPSIVTQGGPIVVGRCWPFLGERGHLVIALSQKVTISHVTLGHISKTVSPTGNISSAPKMFAVYGMKTKEDEGTLLGTFRYDQDDESVQDFKLSDQEEGVFSYVKLQVESNWGNPDYTCVYNFGVHGTI